MFAAAPLFQSKKKGRATICFYTHIHPTSLAYKWIPQEWSLLLLPTLTLLPIGRKTCVICVKNLFDMILKKTGLISHSKSSALRTCSVYGVDLWSREEQFITRKLEIFAVITVHDQENALIVLYVPNVNCLSAIQAQSSLLRPHCHNLQKSNRSDIVTIVSGKMTNVLICLCQILLLVKSCKELLKMGHWWICS